MKTPVFEIADDEQISPRHFLAVRSDGLSFMECIRVSAENNELIAQVDRLAKTNLLGRESALDKMIDDATGRTDADIQTFLRFVWNCVFVRCPELPKE